MDNSAPVHTPLLTRVINDATMPAAIFQSYARLVAAAWQHAYRQTDVLHFERQLVPLLGVRRAQARQHLRTLRFAKLLDWESDGSQHYTIYFPPAYPQGDPTGEPSPPVQESRQPDSVVGVVDSHKTSESIQHQQTGSGNPDSPLEDDPNYQAAFQFLRRAGVWEDTSARLARQIAENEAHHARQGYPPSPGVADVLGWMAYCFADGEKNKIAQPAAVLAANLNARRCCPQEYLPRRVCATCQRAEDHCRCDQPDYHFPPDFAEIAMRRQTSYTTYLKDRWHICQYCHSYPCQCDNDDGE